VIGESPVGVPEAVTAFQLI